MTNSDEVRLDVVFYRLSDILATTALITLTGALFVEAGLILYAISDCIVYCMWG